MSCATKALEQIKNKTYYQQYLAKTKTIILLGIGFSQETRNIADFAQEEINSTDQL